MGIMEGYNGLLDESVDFRCEWGFVMKVVWLFYLIGGNGGVEYKFRYDVSWVREFFVILERVGR